MEVKIKYSELQDFILHNFKKEVSLAFVAPSTVSVSTKIKVFRLCEEYWCRAVC